MMDFNLLKKLKKSLCQKTKNPFLIVSENNPFFARKITPFLIVLENNPFFDRFFYKI